jgi:cytoskeleton protein RodZ
MTESVGSHLRELRTRRGISLEEMARITRVAPRYLQALESDAVNELPAPVFIRGFIRAYCQALGESPEEALAVYDGRGGRPMPRPGVVASPRPDGRDTRGRSAVVISFVLLVVLGIALFAVTLVIRPGERAERSTIEVRPPSQATTTPPAPTPPATAPAAPAPTAVAPAGTAPAAPASPPPTATAPSTATGSPQAPPAARPAPTSSRPEAPARPTPQAATPPDASSAAVRGAVSVAPASLESLAGSVSAPYRLIARTSDLTWIRVRTEDGRTSEETLPAGEVREWVSDRPFILTVGNAGGVSLELNGRALPSLGPRGVVVPRLVLPPEGR